MCTTHTCQSLVLSAPSDLTSTSRILDLILIHRGGLNFLFTLYIYLNILLDFLYEENITLGIMYGQESADSLGAQILHHATRRRYRGFTIPIVALTLLYTIWICSGLVMDAVEQRPLSGFSFADSNGSHQTHTEEQESNEPHWATQNPKTNTGHLIPPKIWQILLPKKQTVDNVAMDPDTLRDTPSWLVMNPDYT